MLIYRLILTLAAPVLLLLQGWQRGSFRLSLRESLGFMAPPPQGPTFWLHGASNGEISSARWLVARLTADHPGLCILITSNTATARRMVQSWAMPTVIASYAPLDAWGATARVLDRWQPKALVSLEAELWPERLLTCARRGVPVAMIGARMSAKSHHRWRMLGFVIRPVLAQVTTVSAQDDSSRRRLANLGIPAPAICADFDLKAQAAREPVAIWANRADRAGSLLAASTHDGEDEAILDAFIAAKTFTHLILAPRHPSRAPAITALIAARSLTFAARSSGALPGPEAVFLADTMGEMDLWYAQSGACIIGGTFARKGGHSPWDPVRYGCAILHGPSTENFATPFATLDAAQAAIALSSPMDLAKALQTLDPGLQDRLAITARQVLVASGDPNSLINQLLRVTGL